MAKNNVAALLAIVIVMGRGAGSPSLRWTGASSGCQKAPMTNWLFPGFTSSPDSARFTYGQGLGRAR